MSSTAAIPKISSTSDAGVQHPARPAHGSVFPALDKPDSRPAGALATVVGPTHPVRTFTAALVLAYVLIAGMSIALALLVTRVLITNSGIARGDEFFVRFLSHHRSPSLTEASLIGSIMAGGVVLPILVGVVAVAAICLTQWRVAAFVVFALAVESAAYRTTTLLVHRNRPPVHRLEHLPVNASYPSGHTAASIAVYCGLALLLTSRISSRAGRYAIWAIAGAIPVFVALSRMYRGMHHPLDILGGVAIGVGTLVLMLIVCRAAGIAVAGRSSAARGA
jgi:membrane-associated phospholipid phosphatase